MRLRTNKKAGKSLAVLLLDAFQKNVAAGYTNNPLEYTICAHPDTLIRIEYYLKAGMIYDKGTAAVPAMWGFKSQEDPRMTRGFITFTGQNTIEFIWTEEHEV